MNASEANVIHGVHESPSALGAHSYATGSVAEGIGAIAVIVLAIIGLAPMTLILVALLALGASTLFNVPTTGRAVRQ